MLSFANSLFISDLHLTEDRPDCIRAFFSFLDWIPPETDALFILGDFFEYWVGDDITSDLSASVANKLAQSSLKKNLSLFFIPGNRDFSLGQKYCDLCNMTLLTDNTLVTIAETKIHLSHGDLLCTDDRKYQRFRKIIRSKVVMSILRSMPKVQRVKLANHLRNKSKQAFRKNQIIIDVNLTAVKKIFRSEEVNMMIHGHTHLADIHLYDFQDINYTRLVLGDWHTVGWYAKLDHTGPSLHQFAIDAPMF